MSKFIPSGRIRQTLCLSAIALPCFILSACGDKEKTANKDASQVAAKVGSEEISVHQINQFLGRMNTANATPAEVKAMSSKILERLIDQQLEVNQALESKLQRSPDVVNQIEAAKNEILARAYLQQLTAGLPKPTEDEVKAYYDAHPQLFSERKVFNVQEAIATPAPGVLDAMRGFAGAHKSVEDVIAWLKANNVKFTAGAATRAAEQIPLELLPSVAGLKEGQALVIEEGQNIAYLRVVSSHTAPVELAAAQKPILQFLMNERTTAAINSNLKRLRQETKISYVGEFSAPAAPTSPAIATTPANAASSPASASNSALERGVAGLK